MVTEGVFVWVFISSLSLAGGVCSFNYWFIDVLVLMRKIALHI